MHMHLTRRLVIIATLVGVMALAAGSVAIASPSRVGLGSSHATAAGTIDDGSELLPQAKIGVEQAIAAAQTAANGNIGEIDLEYDNGTLVFNVDVGDKDVKVDATTGVVIRADSDD
jgi:hypothetical protein